ncbi:hypothetical protein [Chamaesiphon minutus]|nr:hypothetical protein [Chamaesiphon minutus]
MNVVSLNSDYPKGTLRERSSQNRATMGTDFLPDRSGYAAGNR